MSECINKLQHYAIENDFEFGTFESISEVYINNISQLEKKVDELQHSNSDLNSLVTFMAGFVSTCNAYEGVKVDEIIDIFAKEVKNKKLVTNFEEKNNNE